MKSPQDLNLHINSTHPNTVTIRWFQPFWKIVKLDHFPKVKIENISNRHLDKQEHKLLKSTV